MTRTTESNPRPHPGDIFAALGLLTRLPLPAGAHRYGARGARAAWAWPVAGAMVGLLAGALGALAMAAGVGGAIAAGLALAAAIAMTGALHEDGLADTLDGLWGGTTPERRLEIMKDSRIGTYGTLGLILSVGLRWAALAVLFQAGTGWAAMIAAGVLSRAPMAVLSRHLAPARPGGLSTLVGRPPSGATILGVGAALAIALPVAGVSALAATVPIGLSAWALAHLARRKIGGQTGDILGAAQQLAEITALVTFAAAVTP